MDDVEELDGGFLARTDSDGSFAVDERALPPGEWIVEAAGCPSVRTRAGGGPVRLVTGAPIKDLIVEVIAPDGSPVAFASYSVMSWDGVASGSPTWEHTVRGRTVLGIPDGVITRVRIEILDALDDAGDPLEALPIKATFSVPPSGPLRIQLESPLAIAGRVLDETGRPLPDVQLEAEFHIPYATPYMERPAAISDTEGRFRLVGLRAGAHDLIWIDQPQGSVLLGSWGVDAGTEGVELRVVEAGQLTGTVQSQLGAPIALIRVGLRILGDASRDRHASTQTAADGSFHFARIPQGARCEVCVTAQRRGDQMWLGAGPFEIHDAAQPLAIVLERGESLVGRVRRLPPVALDEVEVQIESLLGGDVAVVRADEDGSFRFGPLDRGTWWVRARHVAAAAWGERTTVEVPAAALNLVVELPAALEGRLVGASNDTPIQFSAGDRTCEALPGTVGQFRLYPPQGVAGTLFAHDHANGRYALLAGASAAGGPYELAWQPGSEISGRLPEDLPYIPNAPNSVGASGELGNLYGTIDMRSRTFLIRGVPPGNWDVSARVWGRPTLYFCASGVTTGSTDVMLKPK